MKWLCEGYHQPVLVEGLNFAPIPCRISQIVVAMELALHKTLCPPEQRLYRENVRLIMLKWTRLLIKRKLAVDRGRSTIVLPWSLMNMNKNYG